MKFISNKDLLFFLFCLIPFSNLFIGYVFWLNCAIGQSFGPVMLIPYFIIWLIVLILLERNNIIGKILSAIFGIFWLLNSITGIMGFYSGTKGFYFFHMFRPCGYAPESYIVIAYLIVMIMTLVFLYSLFVSITGKNLVNNIIKKDNQKDENKSFFDNYYSPKKLGVIGLIVFIILGILLGILGNAIGLCSVIGLISGLIVFLICKNISKSNKSDKEKMKMVLFAYIGGLIIFVILTIVLITILAVLFMSVFPHALPA